MVWQLMEAPSTVFAWHQSWYYRLITFAIVQSSSHYADLAVTAKNGGQGFPTPDGYIAAIAASRGFIVASRDSAPYEAACVTVINPWKEA
jgi:predicted nucleic acid-binding protein